MRTSLVAVALLGAFFAVGALAADTPDRQVGQLPYLQMLNGSPRLLGTLTSTDGGSANNWNTADAGGSLSGDGGAGGGAFDAGFGGMLLTQCKSAVYFAVGASATLAATNSDVKLAADEKFYTLLTVDRGTVAVKPTNSGACLQCCSVFRME